MNSPFTAVIFQDNLAAFGDLQKLKTHDVKISGPVVDYRGKPEIILESTNQIKVIERNGGEESFEALRVKTVRS